MEVNNASTGGFFILVGFSDQPWLEEVLLLIISVLYILSLVGNGTIIVVSQLDTHLHTPMYFFLTHLSIIDLCLMPLYLTCCSTFKAKTSPSALWAVWCSSSSLWDWENTLSIFFRPSWHMIAMLPSASPCTI